MKSLRRLFSFALREIKGFWALVRKFPFWYLSTLIIVAVICLYWLNITDSPFYYSQYKYFVVIATSTTSIFLLSIVSGFLMVHKRQLYKELRPLGSLFKMVAEYAHIFIHMTCLGFKKLFLSPSGWARYLIIGLALVVWVSWSLMLHRIDYVRDMIGIAVILPAAVLSLITGLIFSAVFTLLEIVSAVWASKEE